MPASAMNFHVLLVDDDLMISSALKEFLEILGYRVSTAGDCQEAVSILEKGEKVDVMFLDYLMPSGTGTDLLRVIGDNEALQRPPVIMSSSIIDPSNPDWRELYERLPQISQKLIHGYAQKPYTFENIEELLTRTLNNSPAPTRVINGGFLAPFDTSDKKAC